MSDIISMRKDEQEISIVLHADLVASRLQEYVEKSKEIINENDEFSTLLLNLDDVKYVDSKGITYVIGLYKTVCSMNKGFKVVGLRKDIFDLFQLMRLNSLFPLEQRIG